MIGNEAGLLVAVLGGPGSGKSTITKALPLEFANSHAAQRIYLGSGDGDRSFARSSLRLLRRTGAKSHLPAPVGIKNQSRAESLASRIFHLLWAISLAFERRRKLRRAAAARFQGALVITDRYPQIEIAGYNDGPLLGWLGGPLARWERRQYDPANVPAPDLIIKLVASPEVLQSRRPQLSREALVQKQDGIVALSFRSSHVLILDATEPFTTVLRRAKEAIDQLYEARFSVGTSDGAAKGQPRT